MTDEKKAATAAAPTPPAGMQQVDTALDAQPKHNWDENPILTGKVLKIKETEVTNKRTGEVRDTRFAVIETENGEEQLWESANLKELFDGITPGSKVWVLFKGMVKLDGNRSMRMFDAYVS